MKYSQPEPDALALFAKTDLVFGGVGLTFLLLGLGWGAWCLSWNSGSAVVTGKVVRMVRVDPGQGRGSKPQAEYQVEGQTYQITSVISANPPAYAVGASVTIRFRPQAPSEAVIDSLVDRWLFPLAFTAFGFVFTAVGSRALLRKARGNSSSVQEPATDLALGS